jgi:hypothetical protein
MRELAQKIDSSDYFGIARGQDGQDEKRRNINVFILFIR